MRPGGNTASRPGAVRVSCYSSASRRRAREAEDHLPPGRPGRYRGRRVWPEVPATLCAKACSPLVHAGTAHFLRARPTEGPQDGVVVVVAPWSASSAGLCRVWPPSFAAAAPEALRASASRRRKRRRRDTCSRRSHQRRSAYQRAHPYSRGPAGRAEGRADRDCLDQ